MRIHKKLTMKAAGHLLLILVTALVVGCGDSGGTEDDPPNPPVVNTGDGDGEQVNRLGQFVYMQTQAVADQTTDRWQSYFAAQMNAALAPFNSLGNLLDEDVNVIYDRCGITNAFYNLVDKSITICDELVDATLQFYNGDYDATVFAVNFILYHEIAHALVDLRSIPTTGNSESTADSFAAVFSGETGRSFGSILGANFLSTQATSYAGEHIGGEDRAGDLICWAVGSDGNLLFNQALAGFVQPYIEANRNCIGEYDNLRSSSIQLLPELARLGEFDGEIIPNRISLSDPQPPKNVGGDSFQQDGIAQLVNGSDFWFCQKPDDLPISYAFWSDSAGVYVFFTNAEATDTDSLLFSYTLTGADSVDLLYEFDDGTSFLETISSIAFTGSDVFTGFSNFGGQLSCSRTALETTTIAAAKISELNVPAIAAHRSIVALSKK